MQKFKQHALMLIKQAVFQGKPFWVLTIDDDDLNCAFEGNENKLVEALTLAMQNDTDLKRIIKRAVSRNNAEEIKPTLLKLKTA